MKYTSLGLHSVEIKVKYYSVIFMCMNVIFYFLQSVPQCAFFSKIKYPTNLLTLASTFTKLYFELFWQNLLNVALLLNFFFHLPLDIQYLWGKHIDINRTFFPCVKFCFYHQTTVWQEERMSVKCLHIRKPQMDFPTLWTLSEKNTSLMNT